MWCVTEHGFFTFVVDRKDPSQVWLRARLREDLERNFPGVEVHEHPGADYLFRAKIPRIQLAERMAELVMDANITSHFKDEAIRRSAKPAHGSRSAAYYGFWTAMAATQPYAPYSKTPRAKVKPWTPPAARTGGSGQAPAFSGAYGRDFDWDQWDGGVSSPDPARPITREPGAQRLIDAATDEEFDAEWAAMTPEEQQAFLDHEEIEARAFEEAVTSTGPTVNVYPSPATWAPRDWARVEAERRDADKERSATLRSNSGGGGGGRKNRRSRKKH